MMHPQNHTAQITPEEKTFLALLATAIVNAPQAFTTFLHHHKIPVTKPASIPQIIQGMLTLIAQKKQSILKKIALLINRYSNHDQYVQLIAGILNTAGSLAGKMGDTKRQKAQQQAQQFTQMMAQQHQLEIAARQEAAARQKHKNKLELLTKIGIPMVLLVAAYFLFGKQLKHHITTIRQSK